MPKLLLISILLTVTFCTFKTEILAQCESEPTIENTGKILMTKDFKSDAEQIFVFEIKASSLNASWAIKGAEAAVLTVFVNGKYNQDIILFAGNESFNHQVLLGKVQKGTHQLSVVLNKARSAPNVKTIIIQSFKVISGYHFLTESNGGFGPRGVEAANIENVFFGSSPVIYARPNTIDKFSDIPLLIYYEIFYDYDELKDSDYRIRYSAIFSHEDGGTQATALMARWGRMTDIEWVYEVRYDNKRESFKGIFQGTNHITTNFKGTRVFGNHPLIYTVTDNNNFADKGCSALRFAPVPIRADLSKGSRETLMEQFPWTYRIMAQEVLREGRVGEKIAVNTIENPRNYLYVETYAENKNSAVSIELTDEKGNVSKSDFDNPLLRVNRNGYFRIAVRLPAKEKLKEISVRCHAVNQEQESTCGNTNIIKIIKLDENYFPREVPFEKADAKNLAPMQGLIFKFK